MKSFLHLIFLAVLISLTACEKHADLTDQKRYTGSDFNFLFPANWEVIQEGSGEGVRYLYIETPGLAFVQVAVYDQEDAFTLREFANYSIENTEERFFGSRDKGSLQRITKSFAGKIYNGLRNEYVWTIAFFRTRQVTEFFKLPITDTGVFVTTMAPLDNLDKVEKGFELIVSSFKQE